MQRRILHVAENPGRVIEFAVVQISQGGEGLCIPGTVAGIQGSVVRKAKCLGEPGELANQHGDVAFGVKQVLAGSETLCLACIGAQQTLVHKLIDGQLGRAVGFEQAGFNSQGKILPRFGVLELIEEHGRHEHRVDAVTLGFPQDDRLEHLKPGEGVGSQGGELIKALGEQLGQFRLRSVDAEAPLKAPQFFGTEVDRVGPLAFAAQGAGAAAIAGHVGRQARIDAQVAVTLDNRF